jgi:hypothetical protein
MTLCAFWIDIQIQMKTNEIQIGGEGIENLLVNIVLEFF